MGVPQTDFDLDSHNLGDGSRATDSGSCDFAEGDSANDALIDVLLKELERRLERDLGVDARALKNVDPVRAVEIGEDLVDALLDALGRAVRRHGGEVEGALDAEHDLVRILRILAEVVGEQCLSVALGGAVVIPPVPEGHARLDGGAHGADGLLVRDWGNAGGEAHEAEAS